MLEQELDAKSFEKVIVADKPVLVDFFATWCGPCQMMMPIIEEVAQEAKNFSVEKLDIDKAPKVAAKHNVMSVPTFILFKNGREVIRVATPMPKDLLLDKINQALGIKNKQ